MSLQIVMCLFLAICNATFGKVPKIVGGVDASIVDFPYLAALKRISSGQHICGGAIISNRHILTAAHCVSEHFLLYSDIVILIGSDTLSLEPLTMLVVQNIYVHNKFTGKTDITSLRLNDIALIKVGETIEFNQFRKKIDLPTSDIINSEVAFFAGWGTKSYPSDIIANKLQQTLMRILDVNTCGPFFPFALNSDQFCGFHSIGIGICIGDSGGPLVYNGILVGIASISIPCATGIPDLFSNVYSHLDFIAEYLNNE